MFGLFKSKKKKELKLEDYVSKTAKDLNDIANEVNNTLSTKHREQYEYIKKNCYECGKDGKYECNLCAIPHIDDNGLLSSVEEQLKLEGFNVKNEDTGNMRIYRISWK